jgi:hypothetical protein
MNEITFIVTTNNERILNDNLLICPDLFNSYELVIIRNSNNLTKSIQEQIDKSKNNIVCLLHHDIRFLFSFESQMIRALKQLKEIDPDWALAGVAGVKENLVVGHIVDRHYVLGSAIENPIEVDNLDEVLIFFNKSSGLRLDEKITTHHLWATDLCLQAKERNLKCYIVESLIHHNSKNGFMLDPSYYQQAIYIKKKWEKYLPFKNTCMEFKKESFWSLIKNNLIKK